MPPWPVRWSPMMSSMQRMRSSSRLLARGAFVGTADLLSDCYKIRRPMAARKRQLFVLFQNYKRASQAVFVGQAQVRGQGVGGGPFGGGAGQGKIRRATFFTQYR